MPDKELGSLSSEDISKFNAAVANLDTVLSRQEEILQKVLDSEVNIANIRIAGLNTYFDTYLDSLNKVAKKASEINEAYLILEKYAEDVGKQAGKDASKGGGSSGSGSGGGTPPTSSGDNSGGGNTNDGSIQVGKVAADEAVDSLSEVVYEDLTTLAKRCTDYFTQTQEAWSEHMNSSADLVSEMNERRRQQEENRAKAHADSLVKINQKIIDVEIARAQTAEEQENNLTDLRLASQLETLDIEKATADQLNRMRAQQAFSSPEHSEEAGGIRARQSAALDMQKTLQAMEEKRAAFIAKKELEYKLKNNGVLDKEAAKRIQEEASESFKLDEDNLKKLNEKRIKLEAAKEKTDERNKMRQQIGEALHAGTTTERYEAMKELVTNEKGEFDSKKALTAAALAVSDFAKKLEGTIDTIAGKQTLVDTRLQGSKNKKFAGSYWDQLVRDMTSIGAFNPYFKQEDFAANIESLVDKGIAFDLKQRAFLMTIHEKIAKTFEAADGTLLRLIRIQQQDSTAGRLGMEAALNSFLNSMYETSEYMTEAASGVRSSLAEMESLMQGDEAAEVEYQVQKWLGSLFSVGMSQEAVNSISTALGQIASGQIEGLVNGGAGNLLIMAANDANIPIADILTDGITADETNRLLQAAVDYLAELLDASKDNKVVQQQLATVFGVKASDLRAATNLVGPGYLGTISGSSLTYDQMLGKLAAMAETMGDRTSMAEMLENIWKNGEYTLAGSMASNPVSYTIYKVAKLLDDAAGGIDLPFLNVMGFGVDLNTTVSDLMRVAAVGTGILGNLGPMLSGLGSSFSGKAMLNKLDIGTGTAMPVTPRGVENSQDLPQGGGNKTTSGSGYAGNASGSDIKNSTVQESEDSKKQQMIEAKEEAEANQVDVLNNTVIKIYELLDEVAHGKSSLSVRVESYGLTKNGGSNGALGGTAALGNSSSGLGSSAASDSSGSSNTGSTSLSGSFAGSVNLGGWTTQL